MQDRTTKSNKRLWSVTMEKHHERRKPHLCNLQFGPRHRKADHRIPILLVLNIVFTIPIGSKTASLPGFSHGCTAAFGFELAPTPECTIPEGNAWYEFSTRMH